MLPNQDFRDLFSAFNAHHVEFLIVGAHALAVHGHVRATKDLDVWVKPDPENGRRVLAALEAFGARVHAIREGDFSEPGITFQIGVEPVISTLRGGRSRRSSPPERCRSGGSCRRTTSGGATGGNASSSASIAHPPQRRSRARDWIAHCADDRPASRRRRRAHRRPERQCVLHQVARG